MCAPAILCLLVQIHTTTLHFVNYEIPLHRALRCQIVLTLGNLVFSVLCSPTKYTIAYALCLSIYFLLLSCFFLFSYRFGDRLFQSLRMVRQFKSQSFRFGKSMFHTILDNSLQYPFYVSSVSHQFPCSNPLHDPVTQAFVFISLN